MLLKPAPFVYRAARHVEEALSLLAELGEDARVLAGGQSLVAVMNFRLARPSALVDLNRVSDLSYVQATDGAVRIGAMTRDRELEHNADVAARCPLLRRSTLFVGHFQIRNRATVGGSLAHADPAAEYPAVALALDAELVVRGPAGERTVRADEFFLGPFTTALAHGEILVEARFPAHAQTASFKEVARRHGDFAIAAVAVSLEIGQGAVKKAGVGLAGVGGTAIKARAAEELLVGQPLGDELFREAAATAASNTDPQSDIHGSADYRRSLVETLTFRALREAAAGGAVEETGRKESSGLS